MHRQLDYSNLVTWRRTSGITELVRDDQFRSFLEQSRVGPNGRSLTKRAAGDYVSRCRRIEALLGCDLDVVDANAEVLAGRVENRAGDMAVNGVRSLQTALRRYIAFRQAVART